MSVYEWIYQIVVEGIKYVILAHWYFGYEFSRKKTRYLLLLYLVLIPVVEIWADGIKMPEIVFYYKNLWGLCLLLCCFSAKVFRAIKGFFMIWFLIAIADAIIMVCFRFVPTLTFTSHDMAIKIVLGCIGALIWMLVAWKMPVSYKRRIMLWSSLSNRDYILLLLLLALLSLFVGGIQGYLYEVINNLDIAREIIFLLGIMAAGISVVICIGFLYTWKKKDYLEKINRFNASYMELQKKYYEDSLKQYEDMRSFRHDINNHIYVLSELSREDKIDELKKYIARMAQSYKKSRSIHTGNFVADCIISHALSKLNAQDGFQFQLDGYFPEKFFMEDIDFCILLSNLLDNAREALEKVEGKRLLHIEVKRYRQWLYLVVRNSIDNENIDFEHTSKLDGMNHGYGTQNIRHVAEKYDGMVQWKVEEGMAVVVIKFDGQWKKVYEL